MIDPIVNNVIYDYAHAYEKPGDETNSWTLYFSINSQSQFRIDGITLGSVFGSARIYKVIGLY